MDLKDFDACSSTKTKDLTQNSETNSQQVNQRFKYRKIWSFNEDIILKEAQKVHGSNWMVIAEYLDGRNASQCSQRWKRIKPKTEKTRQKWDKKDDQRLLELVKEYNLDWRVMAPSFPNRTSRQLRERYINHLDPKIVRKEWTPKEDRIIWKMYKQMGSRWAEIAKYLKGRPQNMLKNRFYGFIRMNYGNQQNPYYQFPQQKRELLIDKEMTDQRIVEQEWFTFDSNYYGQNIQEQTSRMIEESDEKNISCDYDQSPPESGNYFRRKHKVDWE